jgi:elongator complex protein 6
MVSHHPGASTKTTYQGLDIQRLIDDKRLIYIDGLNVHDLPSNSQTPATSLDSLSLDSLKTSLSKSLQTISATAKESQHQPTLIIESLDFLLAASPPDAHVDATAIQQFTMKLQAQCRNLVLGTSADSPLLHNRHEASMPLEREHGALVATLAHQASLVYQLRGLDTGAARDITGVMRISRGGGYFDGGGGGGDEGVVEVGEVVEGGEWLYQWKGDGSVRLWSRGE